jgi:hypothetical protein
MIPGRARVSRERFIYHMLKALANQAVVWERVEFDDEKRREIMMR